MEAFADVNLSGQDARKDQLVKEGLMRSDQDILPIDDIYTNLYKKDYFHNLNYEMFKNYLQQINTALESKTVLSRYRENAIPELANLKTQTLVVPEYLNLKLNAFTSVYELDEDFIGKTLRKYDSTYEVVSGNEISQRILDGNDFYYLRYASISNWQFIEVVHSTTGNVIFSNHESTGIMSFNLRSKHFKNLTKQINRF
jgi:hypothetical protein